MRTGRPDAFEDVSMSATTGDSESILPKDSNMISGHLGYWLQSRVSTSGLPFLAHDC
jgi:hypothetical protein